MIVSSASPLSRIVSANSRCSAFERRVEQQAAHADDGVHRRADLVAHRRQEGALGLVGGFGLGAGFLRLAEQRGVLNGDGRLPGECLQQRGLLCVEPIGSPARHDQGADGLPVAEHRDEHGRNSSGRSAPPGDPLTGPMERRDPWRTSAVAETTSPATHGADPCGATRPRGAGRAPAHLVRQNLAATAAGRPVRCATRCRCTVPSG